MHFITGDWDNKREQSQIRTWQENRPHYGITCPHNLWIVKNMPALHIFLRILFFFWLVLSHNYGFAGGSCPVFIGGLSSQLWLYSQNFMWRQWPDGCTGPNAGNQIKFKHLLSMCHVHFLFVKQNYACDVTR